MPMSPTSTAIRPHFDGIDWVFHLAALADIVPSIEAPIPYHRANVDGTVNVLEAARHAGVKRFVYAASSSCYGIPDVYPTPETAETRPMYPYALTKYLGEQCVLHWCKVYKLPAVSLAALQRLRPASPHDRHLWRRVRCIHGAEACRKAVHRGR